MFYVNYSLEVTFWTLDYGIGSFVGKIKLSPLSLVHEMVYDPTHNVTFSIQCSNVRRGDAWLGIFGTY